jgi:hypothetical protein
MGTSTESAETPMHAKPQAEHEWLHKLVGDWTVEAEMQMPDGTTAKSTGTESVRSLGGLWIVGEGDGEMPDGTRGKSIITLGYDPERERYVGSWIGSMMSNMWVYDGELDAEGKVLSLDTEGPDFSGEGGTARYQERIELVSDDHRIFRSGSIGDDGEWHMFMEAHYRRKV